MGIDIRLDAARYYDYSPASPQDLPFYIQNLPSPQAKVLELGCGTGRVTIPLSLHCASVRGIDLSSAMISICREKLLKEEIFETKVKVDVGDITNLDLGQKYDLIIAPFRVFQNLETDGEVDGFFDSVRGHLAPQGTCILNVFNPNRDRETMRRDWCSEDEELSWEVMTKGGRVACYVKRQRMDKKKLLLYPELIYRRYEKDVLVDETILKIVMRCWYPREFEALIEDQGFSVVNRWGGYVEEADAEEADAEAADAEKAYGEGPELVIQFRGEA